jgi:hypothetical protein
MSQKSEFRDIIGRILDNLTAKDAKKPGREKYFLVSKKSPQAPANFSDEISGGISPPNIMQRPVKLGIASLKALGTVLALGVAARASMPYLPLIGPPPLRMQPARSPAPAVTRFEEFQPATVPTATNLAAATGTNALAANNPNAASTTNGPDATVRAAAPDATSGDAFAASVLSLPTPNLLGITPQMLAAYFQPGPETNSAALTGPFRVRFIPPLPPDKSSHAEYNVK